jgi:hypothetical protein
MAGLTLMAGVSSYLFSILTVFSVGSVAIKIGSLLTFNASMPKLRFARPETAGKLGAPINKNEGHPP